MDRVNFSTALLIAHASGSARAIKKWNTLDFSSDEGVKNIAWVFPGIKMYEKALLEEVFSQSSTDPPTYKTVVQGFNEECFELFTNIIIDGNTR
jgi:hypothetical protein